VKPAHKVMLRVTSYVLRAAGPPPVIPATSRVVGCEPGSSIMGCGLHVARLSIDLYRPTLELAESENMSPLRLTMFYNNYLEVFKSLYKIEVSIK
jgi:hypothetical protein